jgi:quinoprotein glucose dehydrogenase
VAQSTDGAVFTFNRETGELIFGMEERPVPQTNVAGEWTSPTQPFPVARAAHAQSHDARGSREVTPEHKALGENFWDSNGFADVVCAVEDRRVLLNLPGAQGGSNWQGVTYNKALGLLIGNVMDAGQYGKLQPQAPGGRRGAAPPAAAAAPPTPAPPAPPGPTPPTSYGKTPGPTNRFWNNANMWSCSAPPWGQLVAVNANTGDIVWRVPLGEFEELTKLGVPQTGTPLSGGGISTAGNLVFIGATIDGYFRAFDARNGKELWKDRPRRLHSGHLHGPRRQAVRRRRRQRRRVLQSSDVGRGHCVPHQVKRFVRFVGFVRFEGVRRYGEPLFNCIPTL